MHPAFDRPLTYEPTGYKTTLGQEIYAVDAFTYTDRDGTTYSVKQDYRTDLATMPFGLDNVFPPDGPWAQAAVLHDMLWGKAMAGKMTFAQADLVFLHALEDLHINPFVRALFYLSVRAFATIRDFINWAKG